MRRALIAAIFCLAEAAGLAASYPTGVMIERVACASDPTQTYTVYLPSNYSTDRTWPVLFVFDPRRRGTFAANLFREPAERFGWIIASSNDTISDGEWEPNARAVQAMWPDVPQRFAVDQKRIYAAGFSGGAIVAWLLGQNTGRLAGIISCGGRLAEPGRADKASFAWYGTAGDIDFNYSESRSIDRQLDQTRVPHRLVIFAGPHRWAPPELLAQGVEWMEIQAMRQGRHAVDQSLVDAAFDRDATAAKALEDRGDVLNALRRYRAIAATYEGVHDVTAAKAAAEQLSKDRAVAKAEKDEKYWDSYEQQFVRRAMTTIQEALLDPAPINPSELSRSLEIASLLSRARGESYGARTAQRILEQLMTQTSFYLMRDLMGRQRYQPAAALLKVATDIHPENAAVWYNLACALARSGGNRRPALAALEKAVSLGYKDAQAIESDADLASLQGDPRFAAVLNGLRQARQP